MDNVSANFHSGVFHWLTRIFTTVLSTTVSVAKANRGLSVIDTYTLLKNSLLMSSPKKRYKKAASSGWCVELLAGGLPGS